MEGTRVEQDEQRVKVVVDAVMSMLKQARTDERERTLAAVKVKLGKFVDQAVLDEVLNQ